MCYADTATETDNTVTAFCYCGSVDYGHTPESADAAEAHENASDVIDDTAAVAA